MKKFINVLAVLLALVMCLGIVVACAGDEEDKANEGETTPASTTTQATTTKTPPVTTTVEVTTTADARGERTPTPTVDVPADGVITTAEQLHAVLVNGAVDKDYTVNATKLDMKAYTWKGMTGYSGTFDFNGCVIENAMDSLFISVIGGTVKNLTLANSTYNYTNDEALADINPATNAEGNLYYSPVVRYATDIVVENVTIESTVSIRSDIWTDGSSHGGVVGQINKATNALVSNCTFNGTIATDSLIVRVGGVVGYISGTGATCVVVDAPETSTVRVERCTNNGLVQNLGTGKDSKAGGVVGYMEHAAAVYCANYGEMDSNDTGQTAGVIGYIGGTAYIKNCINTGKVRGANFVGGVCAYSNGSARYIENCINLGKVEYTTDNWGGIIGLTKSEEKLTNCFNLYTEAGTLKFSHENNTLAAVDPADSTTHGKLIITNCANLDSVDAIFNAMDTVNAGVFEKTADGTSIQLVAAQ